MENESFEEPPVMDEIVPIMEQETPRIKGKSHHRVADLFNSVKTFITSWLADIEWKKTRITVTIKGKEKTKKVGAIAKKLLVSTKDLKKAHDQDMLEMYAAEMSTRLDEYKSLFKKFKENKKLVVKEGKKYRITAKQLMRVTSTALLTLKKGESMMIAMKERDKDRTHTLLATKGEDGTLLISKKEEIIGQGAFGKVDRYQTIFHDRVADCAAKFACIQDQKLKEEERREKARRATKDVRNEFHILTYIHSLYRPATGIQDAPFACVGPRKDDRQGTAREGEGETGYLGVMYDHNGGSVSIEGEALLYALCQVCCGLQVLEETKIVHGDIKPENMLIRNSKVHLADFGGAKILKNDLPLEKFTWGVHTPVYTNEHDRDAVVELHKQANALQRQVVVKQADVLQNQVEKLQSQVSESLDEFLEEVAVLKNDALQVQEENGHEIATWRLKKKKVISKQERAELLQEEARKDLEQARKLFVQAEELMTRAKRNIGQQEELHKKAGVKRGEALQLQEKARNLKEHSHRLRIKAEHLQKDVRKIRNIARGKQQHGIKQQALELRQLQSRVSQLQARLAELQKIDIYLDTKEIGDQVDMEDQLTGIKNELRSVLQKGDVYSTAVSIYKMATGILYDSERSETIFIGITRHGPFREELLRSKGVPEDIITLLKRALSNDNTERPQPREFIDALSKYKNAWALLK